MQLCSLVILNVKGFASPMKIFYSEFLMNVHHIVLSSCRTRAAPLSIYKDSADTGDTDPHKPDPSHSWHTLGARADRNKENNAIPGKWKSYKVLIFTSFLLAFSWLFINHNITYYQTVLSFGMCVLYSFNAQVTEWFQIPQRPGTRTGGATASAFIPVFVDEECQE